MPVRDRKPEDDQPLARPVNEQPLARPTSGEQEEAAQEAEANGAARQEEQAALGAGGADEKGPVARTMDKAQENNWVYDSIAKKARETGLVDKADELLAKARNRLAGG